MLFVKKKIFFLLTYLGNFVENQSLLYMSLFLDTVFFHWSTYVDAIPYHLN